MKKHMKVLALVTMAVCIHTACGNKKMQNSNTKARVEQLKKDNTVAQPQTEEKRIVATKKPVKKNIVVTKKVKAPVVAAAENKTVTETPTETYTPFPPTAVEDIFNNRYPSATNVAWTKEIPLNAENANGEINDYRVDFLLEEIKYSVVYSKDGEQIEVREQILPDQLPPNIYTAIKRKYPDVHIVYASTCKNKKYSGSYSAIIKTQSNPDNVEIILAENGTFIK